MDIVIKEKDKKKLIKEQKLLIKKLKGIIRIYAPYMKFPDEKQ